jgi:hypothetical protein
VTEGSPPLRFDARGFVDMDAFEAVPPDAAVSPTWLAALRTALVDSGDGLSDERWEQLVDAAVSADFDGADTELLLQPLEEVGETDPFAADAAPLDWSDTDDAESAHEATDDAAGEAESVEPFDVIGHDDPDY